MTTSEYLLYVANLLFALSDSAIGLDPELGVLDTKDYFSIENALLKYPEHPHLMLLVMAHKIIAVSKEFSG